MFEIVEKIFKKPNIIPNDNLSVQNSKYVNVVNRQMVKLKKKNKQYYNLLNFNRMAIIYLANYNTENIQITMVRKNGTKIV